MASWLMNSIPLSLVMIWTWALQGISSLMTAFCTSSVFFEGSFVCTNILELLSKRVSTTLFCSPPMTRSISQSLKPLPVRLLRVVMYEDPVRKQGFPCRAVLFLFMAAVLHLMVAVQVQFQSAPDFLRDTFHRDDVALFLEPSRYLFRRPAFVDKEFQGPVEDSRLNGSASDNALSRSMAIS